MTGRKPRVKPASGEKAADKQTAKKRGRPPRRQKRRQSHGSAWHWKQTDSWYYTLPGTRKRVALFDEDGQRIRGKVNKQAAQMALARVKGHPEADPATPEEWLVARVCSEYIQYCERGVINGTTSEGHRNSTVSYLNDLCTYCGALPVLQLKKGHVRTWIERHTTWKSPATVRAVIAIVLAAFNYAEENHEIANPLKGLKKPPAQPRLHSLSMEDEQTVYGATDDVFREFLFAAIHTGLRPFSELARMTADDVDENERGMMWRVFATKTQKTRKIPLMPQVADLTRKLMETAPKGTGITLFRNSKGTAWTRVAGVHRYLAIKRKLGWDEDPIRKHYSSYTCRHTFCHRMLSGYWNGGQGCSIEVLAELIGDTPKVAFDHYGREWGQHYQEPLWAAIGVPPTTNRSEETTHGG